MPRLIASQMQMMRLYQVPLTIQNNNFNVTWMALVPSNYTVSPSDRIQTLTIVIPVGVIVDINLRRV